MSPDVIERSLKFRLRNNAVLFTNHAPAGAVAAVGGAAECYKEQHTVWIAVNNMGDGAVVYFTERVCHIVSTGICFLNGRHTDFTDRILRVGRVNEGCVVRSYGHAEAGKALRNVAFLLFRHAKEVCNLICRRKAVGVLPLPVVPAWITGLIARSVCTANHRRTASFLRRIRAARRMERISSS